MVTGKVIYIHNLGRVKYPRAVYQRTYCRYTDKAPPTGTVLLVKMYPNEGVSVKLDGLPVVVTLRNVQISTPTLSHTQAPGDCTRGLRNVRDICEGMSLIFHDMGVWNVNTTAFHNASVSLYNDSDRSGGKCQSTMPPACNVSSSGPAFKSSAVLPKRRKHSAMSSV